MDNQSFQVDVLQRLSVIETLLKQQDYKGVSELSSKAYDLAKKNEEVINEIKDKNKWYFRTIVGCVLTTLISVLLSFLKFS